MDQIETHFFSMDSYFMLYFVGKLTRNFNVPREIMNKKYFSICVTFQIKSAYLVCYLFNINRSMVCIQILEVKKTVS